MKYINQSIIIPLHNSIFILAAIDQIPYTYSYWSYVVLPFILYDASPFWGTSADELLWASYSGTYGQSCIIYKLDYKDSGLMKPRFCCGYPGIIAVCHVEQKNLWLPVFWRMSCQKNTLRAFSCITLWSQQLTFVSHSWWKDEKGGMSGKGSLQD